MTPRPREANAFQSVQRFAPLKRLASAWIHESRASVTVRRISRGYWTVDEEEGIHTARVARLELESIQEEVHEDGVARGRALVRARGRGETVRLHERGVDVVQEVRPDLADVVHLETL